MTFPYKRLLRRIGRVLAILMASLLLLLGLALLIIRINSPGREPPFLDEQGAVIVGSLAERLDTTINGARQRLTIRSRDIRNPVLLRIHGGPGGWFSPAGWSFLGTDLEDVFTVCYWDQRGAGPAYSRDLPDSAITLSNIVADGLQISDYLRRRFHVDKIYLEGWSWGTSVGLLMAQAMPDYYHAFIGIGQMGDQQLSEQRSYDYVLAEATARDDTTAIRQLQEIGRPPYDTEDAMYPAMKVERNFVFAYGRQPDFPIDDSGLLDHLLDPGLTFSEKIGPMVGWFPEYPGLKVLWPTCARINLPRDVPFVNIPVHILQGEDDHQTETSVARMYFDSLQAPAKTWHLFEDAGHGPPMYDVPRYRQIMHEISQSNIAARPGPITPAPPADAHINK